MSSMSESESEAASECSESVDKHEPLPDKDRIQIREKLSTMSFEDIQKLKGQMGSKVYNQTVFGIEKTKRKSSFKRLNRNRPREISSKRKIKEKNQIIPVKKPHVARDPRFDPLCGTYDTETFKSNYKFVDEIRKKEKVQLEKELKEIKNPEEKKKMKYVLQRLGNQIREEENREKQKQRNVEEKREIKQQLKDGEKPVFKKKSVKKLESLISQYEELKKTNRLQKHIDKRSKKLSVKDRRQFEKQKLVP